MRCEQWREMLSARLDGEETPAERVGTEGHLITCGDCRAWYDAATTVTRRARTRVVPPVPDLTEAILAAGPGRRRSDAWRVRLVAGLRAVLGLVGGVQLALGLAQVGRGAAGTAVHATGQHLWHESAAWNVAVGAGFLFVAARRFPPAGLLPMLSAFVATLVLLSVNDLIIGQVAVSRLISHGFLLLGWVITVLLSRPGLRPGAPTPGQGHPRASRGGGGGGGGGPPPPPPPRGRAPPPPPPYKKN
ncbi:zf-HC2 domain-containing protein, partial [Micromonospora sp. DT233]|uniref:zf-HC2 domain-containing protein n=1 Tax=Micromonospora sp. DT233 TaxID=3393432 RepID=UPI003CFA8C0F